jgi:hypothetical protein
VTDPATLTADEFDTRIQRLMTSLGERLISAHRDLLREALRRAGERDGVVEALAGTVGEANGRLRQRLVFDGPVEERGEVIDNPRPLPRRGGTGRRRRPE